MGESNGKIQLELSLTGFLAVDRNNLEKLEAKSTGSKALAQLETRKHGLTNVTMLVLSSEHY